MKMKRFLSILLLISMLAGMLPYAPHVHAAEEGSASPVWESGTIASASGQNNTDSTRLRTADYLLLSDYAGAGIDFGYTMTNFVYDADKTFLGTSSWLGSGQSFTTQALLEKYPTGVYFRVVLRTMDSDAISVSDIADTGVIFYAPGEEVRQPESNVKFSNVGSIGIWQDGAIFDGKLFALSDYGTGGVYDLSTAAKLGSLTVNKTDVIKPHANSVCFGTEYFSPEDPYPLLYASVYNNYKDAEDRMEGTCCVYRITESSGVYTGELVQVIKIGFTEDLTLWKSKENNGDVRPYGNFVVDTDANKLYAYTMRDADKTTRFFRFALPGLDAGTYSDTYGCNVVTLESSDIESQFDTAYFSYLQGVSYYNGKIYSAEGFSPSPAVRIVDLATQTLTHTYYPGEAGLTGEAEILAVDPEDGMIYYAPYDGVLRKLTFAEENSVEQGPTVTLTADELCDYYGIREDGSASAASTLACTSYVDCAGAQSLTLTMVDNQTTYQWGLAFYDENKQFLSFVEQGSTGSLQSVEKTVPVPEEAAYFRTTYYNYAYRQSNGHEFSCVLTYPAGDTLSQYRPYQDGYIFFSQEVNQAMEGETPEYKRTTGVLALPENYSATGEPTKLIIYFHGYSHGVYMGTWGSTETFRQQKQNFLDRGYAVMDCNGARDSDKAAQSSNAGAASRQYVEAFWQCFQYVIEHYNIDPQVYVVGGSAGGPPAINFADWHSENVQALMLLSPWTDLYTQCWGQGVRAPFVEYLGFENTTTYEPEKTLEVDPALRIKTRDDGTAYIDSIEVPVRAFVGANETSGIIGSHLATFMDALKVCQPEAELVVWEGRGHEIVSGAVEEIDTAICDWFDEIAEGDSAPKPNAIIFATADFQGKNTTGGTSATGSTEDSTYNDGNTKAAETLTRIIENIKAAGYTKVDATIFCGDYDIDNGSSAEDSKAGIDAVKAVYTAQNWNTARDGTEIQHIFVQGNHEENAPVGTNGLSGANYDSANQKWVYDTQHYGLYLLHEDYHPFVGTSYTDAQIDSAAAELKAYLDEKLAANYSKPIIIAGHVPLHFNLWKVSGIYAKPFFDVLNNAAGSGLNIIYLFGHDHGNYDEYLGGTNIYLPVGSTIFVADRGSQNTKQQYTLNFTYMTAGLSAYLLGDHSGNELNGTILEIYDHEVVIKRYNDSTNSSNHGLTTLGNAGEGRTTSTEAGLLHTLYPISYASGQVVSLEKQASITHAATGVTVRAAGITSVDVTIGTPQEDGAEWKLTCDITPKTAGGTVYSGFGTVTIPMPQEIFADALLEELSATANGELCVVRSYEDGILTLWVPNFSQIEITYEPTQWVTYELVTDPSELLTGGTFMLIQKSGQYDSKAESNANWNYINSYVCASIGEQGSGQRKGFEMMISGLTDMPAAYLVAPRDYIPFTLQEADDGILIGDAEGQKWIQLSSSPIDTENYGIYAMDFVEGTDGAEAFCFLYDEQSQCFRIKDSTDTRFFYEGTMNGAYTQRLTGLITDSTRFPYTKASTYYIYKALTAEEQALMEILSDKQFSILGDSISTYEGVSNSTAVNDTIGSNVVWYNSSKGLSRSDTWWQQAVDQLGMNLLVNNSWSGSSVTSVRSGYGLISYGWNTRPGNLHDNTLSNNPGGLPINPDIIAVHMGTNDFMDGVSCGTTFDDAFWAMVEAEGFVPPTKTDFEQSFALMIYKVRCNYPDADVFIFDYPTINRGTAERRELFNQAIDAVAEHYGCTVIRIADTDLSDYSTYTIDGIHPAAAGMDIMTEAFIDALLQRYVYHEHTPVTDPAVAPTCTATGLTEGSHCNVCGEVIVAQTEIPATGHSYTTLHQDATGYWYQCSGCTATEARINYSELTIRYDDRLNLNPLGATGNVIVDYETVTSYQTGTQLLDSAVLIQVGDQLIAVGTGSATVTWTDASGNHDGYVIKVEKAKISLFMITGHSLGVGEAGDANQSIICPDGQSYSTRLGTTLAANMGLGYGASSRPSGIDALSAAGNGVKGTDSGMAYGWHQLTGEKAWVLNTAVGGTNLSTWTQNGTQYKNAVKLFQEAQVILQKEIAAGHYELNKMGILNHSCANGDATWTIEDYNQSFYSMWEGFKRDFSLDMDGDGQTETVDCIGLSPLWNVCAMSDWGNLKPNPLTFSNGKMLNYIMGAFDPDVIIASAYGRQWTSDSGVKAFFEANPIESFYTSIQSGSHTSPSTMRYGVYGDGVHYNQLGYNVTGIEAIESMYEFWYGQNDVTDLELLQSDGITPVPESVRLEVGESYAVIPNVQPTSGKLTYRATGGIVYENGLVTVVSGGYATLEIYADGLLLKTVRFSAHNIVVDPYKAPTCTATGLTEGSHCSICGEILAAQQTVAALGHSYAATLTQPTCTKGGYTTYQCACGDTYVADVTEALGHSWDEGTVTLEPTEETTGSRLYTCTVCSETKTELIPELEHVHSYTAVVTAPTCTQKGYTTHTCHCGDSYVDTYTDALGHSYEAIVTPPTAEEMGYTTHTCKVCGHSYKDSYTDATGHNPVKQNEKAATCTESGYTGDVICADCGKLLEQGTTIAATGHKSVTDPAVQPTCTETGLTAGAHCETCGEILTAQQTVPATGHSFGDWQITEAAACEAQGTQRRDCLACDAYETQTIAALGHSYTSVVTAPTCTEKGYTTHTCIRCGDSYVDTYTDALGHSFGAWQQTVAPTCTTLGEQQRSCVRCDHQETATVNALGHSYRSAVTASTCTEKGYTTHTCIRCADVYIDSYTDALGHSYGAWTQTKAPTCTAKGEERRACTKCDHYETRSVNVLDHSYNSVVTAPTCTAKGYTTHTCIRCADSYVDTYVDAQGHSYEAVVTPPTAEEMGYTTHTCKRCGDSYKDSFTDATGHNPVKQGEKAATCTENGYSGDIVCADCGKLMEQGTVIPATGHKSVADNAKAPTCTETGLTAGAHCEICGEILTAQQTVPATGHSFGDWQITAAAACEAQGTQRRDCLACDAYETQTIAALGHSYTSAVTAPTCTEKGYTTHTCLRCASTYTDTYVDALGHSWNSGVVTLEPTDNAEGERTYTCILCGTTRVESIPKLNHVHVFNPVITRPTCTQEGYTTFLCSCGSSYVTQKKDPLGHDWENWELTKEPNYLEYGEQKHICARCGEYETEPVNNNPFEDVGDGSRFKTAILWAYYTGVTRGTDATHFAPTNIVNRQQFVMFLWQAAGSPEPETGENPFTDVSPNNRFYKAILWASQNGITTGTGDGTTFSPTANCTRGQVVMFLYRYAGKPEIEKEVENPFTDVSVNNNFYKAILWAYSNNITSGKTATTFEIRSDCQRQHVVTFLYRYLEGEQLAVDMGPD